MEITLNNAIHMTSRDIAELTSKQHSHIMRDIRAEKEKLNIAGINNESIFGLIEYIDEKGEKRPQYLLSKDGIMMLAMKYDTVTRYKITQKLKELENKNNLPTTYIEALEALLESEKQKEKLLIENNKQKKDIEHKVKVIDNLTEHLDATLLRKTATDYVNKTHKETGVDYSEIYNRIYGLVGRYLKKDLSKAFENYKQTQRDLVENNKIHNKENNLRGECRLRPFRLKDGGCNMSMVEYLVDILGEGAIVIEVMAKVFEVSINDIMEKYTELSNMQ